MGMSSFIPRELFSLFSLIYNFTDFAHFVSEDKAVHLS
jgi:hypothetical protein